MPKCIELMKTENKIVFIMKSFEIRKTRFILISMPIRLSFCIYM